jgi:hypothetical protein
MTTENSVSGGFEVETGDAVADVLEFYRAALDAAGFTVSVNTYSADNSEGGMVNANHPDDKRSVVVIVSSESGGPTKASVQFSDEN